MEVKTKAEKEIFRYSLKQSLNALSDILSFEAGGLDETSYNTLLENGRKREMKRKERQRDHR